MTNISFNSDSYKSLLKRLKLIIIICLIYSVNCVAQKNESFESLTHNDKYFIKNIDLNRDKLLDKVISSQAYQGNELYFFIKKGSNYDHAFKGINFSEDGGQIIKEIRQETENDEVLSILTYFPDRGYFTSRHYISYQQAHWILTRSIYEVSNWREDSSKIISCDVQQNIKLEDLTEDGIGWKHFKHLPPEPSKNKVCSTKCKPQKP